MDKFKGKYKRISTENYKEMLQEFDINFLFIKAATSSSAPVPIIEISEENGQWTIKTSSALKSFSRTFKLGEPFDETTADGREVTSVILLEDGKLVSVQTAKKPGVKSTRSVREIEGDEMTYTITVEGTNTVCVQKFVRVQ